MAAAYQDLGLLFYRMGMAEASSIYLLKALSLKQDSTKIMLALGLAYVKLGQPEKALEYVTSLREQNDEQKALHLESMIRELRESKNIREPDASNLVPDLPGRKAPVASAGKSQGKTSVAGKAQVNLRTQVKA